MEKTYLSTSSQDTQEVAVNLIKSLRSGTVICLIGDLAAGKTTFTQGLGDFLGISRVVSPTYMIMREYRIETHPKIKNLLHLDLYRINSAEEIKSFDLEEIWGSDENLVIIEWPEKILDLVPKNSIKVFLKATSDREREIKIIKSK